MEPDALISDTPDFRRSIFYMKTDIPVEDSVLRCLSADNRSEAQSRCKTLAVAVQDALGEQVVNVQPGKSQGTFHLIHQVTLQSGRKMIARSSALHLFERDESMTIDVFAQKALAKVELPSLAVHMIDTSRQYAPFEFMLTDVAKGESIAELGDELMEDHKCVAAVGKAMSRWHQIPVAGAGLIDVRWLVEHANLPRGIHQGWYHYLMVNLDKHVEACAASGFIDHGAVTQIHEWFVQHKAMFSMRPVCLLHGDSGNHNIFLDNGHVSAVVDWEDALAGDPIYDMAFWATFHPARRWAAFFEGYEIKNARAPEFALPFALYFLRITLAKIVHRTRFGYEDAPGRPTGRDRLLQALELVKEAL